MGAESAYDLQVAPGGGGGAVATSLTRDKNAGGSAAPSSGLGHVVTTEAARPGMRVVRATHWNVGQCVCV